MKAIIDIFEEKCIAYKDKNAFLIQTNQNNYRTYNYTQLLSGVKQFSAKLRNSGLIEGDRVALIAENSPEWVVAYFSILYCKCTPVLIDPSLSSKDITDLIHRSALRGVMMSPTARKKLNSINNTEIPTFDILNQADTFKGDAERLSSHFPHTENVDKDIIAIIYSSGTTSSAKGVMMSNEGVRVTAENNIVSNRVTSKDRLLAVIPLCHIYGFMSKMICPILAGATVCFIENVTSENLTNAFMNFKPTLFCGVPRIFEMFANKITGTIASKGKLVTWIFNILINISGSIRKNTGINIGKSIFKTVNNAFGGEIVGFMSAGSMLDKQTAHLYYGLGISLLNNYGITETNIPIASNTFDYITLDTCGKVFKGVSIDIKKSASQDQSGEILVKSPGMMKGYFGDKAATDMAFTETGWFHTGDLGYLDKNNNLVITGRLKENIVLDTGKKVTPDDVEKSYTGILGVSEFIVCGVPKKNASFDEIHAFIVKSKLVNRTVTEIESDVYKISSVLPTHMRIAKIHFIDEVPKTALQKPKRFLLKKMVLEDETQVIVKEDTNQKLNKKTAADDNTQIIYDIISKFKFTDAKVNSNTRIFEDLGFDSLTITEFALQIEEKTNIDIFAFLKPNITIGEIAEYLNNNEAVKNDFFENLSQYPLRRRFIDTLVFKVLKTGLKLLYKFEVTGIENLPKTKGYLLCPNQETYFDAFLILSNLPNKIYERFCGLAKKEYLDNLFEGFMFRVGGGVPVDRYGTPGPSLIRLQEKLLEDAVVLIFPEGTRTEDGKLLEFKKGAAKLSIDTGLPIVPVRLKGGFEIYPKGTPLPKFFNFKKMRKYRLEIIFLPPVQPVNHDADSLTEEIRKSIANEL